MTGASGEGGTEGRPPQRNIQQRSVTQTSPRPFKRAALRHPGLRGCCIYSRVCFEAVSRGAVSFASSDGQRVRRRPKFTDYMK